MMAQVSPVATGIEERIRKRAAYESFSFEVLEAGRVTITNHSYGHEAELHRYSVTVEDGEAVACSCPFNRHREQTCKHMFRIESEPAVIAAASVTPNQDEEGGAQSGGASPNDSEECIAGDSDCPGPGGDDLHLGDAVDVRLAEDDSGAVEQLAQGLDAFGFAYENALPLELGKAAASIVRADAFSPPVPLWNELSN
jgi:hypothetical protein